jgi:hypothetical protein
MSTAICGIKDKTRMSRSLSSGAHSRDPLAHPGYACFRFDQAKKAFAHMESGAHFGKVAIEIR